MMSENEMATAKLKISLSESELEVEKYKNMVAEIRAEVDTLQRCVWDGVKGGWIERMRGKCNEREI